MLFRSVPFEDVELRIHNKTVHFRFAGGELELGGVEIETVGDAICVTGTPQMWENYTVQFFPAGVFHDFKEGEQLTLEIIKQQPPKSRQVLVMTIFGFSAEEIAKQTGKAVKTVQAQQRTMRNAIREVRALMKKY